MTYHHRRPSPLCPVADVSAAPPDRRWGHVWRIGVHRRPAQGKTCKTGAGRCGLGLPVGAADAETETGTSASPWEVAAGGPVQFLWCRFHLSGEKVGAQLQGFLPAPLTCLKADLFL